MQLNNFINLIIILALGLSACKKDKKLSVKRMGVTDKGPEEKGNPSPPSEEGTPLSPEDSMKDDSSQHQSEDAIAAQKKYSSREECSAAGESDDRCCKSVDITKSIIQCGSYAAAKLNPADFNNTLPAGNPECIDWCLNQRPQFDKVIVSLIKIDESTPQDCVVTYYETTLAGDNLAKLSNWVRLHDKVKSLKIVNDKTEPFLIEGVRTIDISKSIDNKIYEGKLDGNTYHVRNTCIAYICLNNDSGCDINCNDPLQFKTNKEKCCSEGQPYFGTQKCK